MQMFDLMKYGKSECTKKNCLKCTIVSKRLPQTWRRSKAFCEAVKNIDTIIAPSEFMKKKLSEWLQGKSDIVHIPNFVPYPPKDIKESVIPTIYYTLECLKAKGNLQYIKTIQRTQQRDRCKSS